jgi:hypothetical protein
MGAVVPSSTFGHLALHYRDVDDGPTAARLLEALDFTLCYSMPRSDSGPFYHFVIDERAEGGTDRIIYLMQMPPAVRSVYDEIAARLALGTAGESAQVGALRSAQARDPELGFHAAIVVHSLEALEKMVQRVTALAASDPELKGRVRVTLNRARPGTPEVDARMDASPIFAGVTRHTYGPNGVQVFVETDLLAGGPLGDNWVFEFDYVFPGFAENILNRPTPKAPAANNGA